VANGNADPMTNAFLAMDAIVADPRDIYIGVQLRMPGTAPPLSALCAEVGEQVAALPALTHVPVQHHGRIFWEPSPDFDLDAHILAGPPLPDTGFHPATALFDDPPDHCRPLWRLWLLPGSGNSWGVCYLAHHALQDAIGVLGTLTTLFGGPGQGMSAAVSRPRTLAGIAGLPSMVADYRRVSGCTPMSVRGVGRQVACLDLPIERLRVIARATGATVNQVYLAAMAIALQTWAPVQWGLPEQRRHRRGLPALMPVDTRTATEPQGGIGNRIGLLRVLLPCADADPQHILQIVARRARRQRIARHRQSFRAAMDAGPQWFARLLLRRITRPGVSVLTVCGVAQRQPLTVCGSEVTRIEAVPWLPPNHDCFTVLAGYRDRAVLSVLTHDNTDDPERLVRGWGDAVDRMYADFAT
jgi:diacylglycerol O-acyltransferase / wax synthase